MTVSPMGALLATPTRMAQQAAVAAVERAALFMSDDLMIEDFARDFDGDGGMDGMKSPGRAGSAVLAAAADIGLDLLQSPPPPPRRGARPRRGSARAPPRRRARRTRGRLGVGDADEARRDVPHHAGVAEHGAGHARVDHPARRAGRLTLNGAPNTRSKQAAPPPRASENGTRQGRGNAKATPVKTRRRRRWRRASR